MLTGFLDASDIASDNINGLQVLSIFNWWSGGEDTTYLHVLGYPGCEKTSRKPQYLYTPEGWGALQEQRPRAMALVYNGVKAHWFTYI